MARFSNIPGGVLDLNTGKKWKLGANTNRTQPAAVTEVGTMTGYAMPAFTDLQELNTASVADMNASNLAPFVGLRIWSATGCIGSGTCFRSIELGDTGNDECSSASLSSSFRALGKK